MGGQAGDGGRSPAAVQAQYKQHRALDSRLAAAGTTLAQWDALRAISRAPGSPARALAAATFQTEQAFGTLAGRLTALGLIDRRPGTGRRIEHYLTPAGEEVLTAGHRIADEVLAACYSGLSPRRPHHAARPAPADRRRGRLTSARGRVPAFAAASDVVREEPGDRPAEFLRTGEPPAGHLHLR